MFGSASDKEWEAWQVLCTLLKESGAVTEADLKSPVGKLDTKGQRILEAIRIWGARNAILYSEHPSDLHDVEVKLNPAAEREAFLATQKNN